MAPGKNMAKGVVYWWLTLVTTCLFSKTLVRYKWRTSDNRFSSSRHRRLVRTVGDRKTPYWETHNAREREREKSKPSEAGIPRPAWRGTFSTSSAHSLFPLSSQSSSPLSLSLAFNQQLSARIVEIFHRPQDQDKPQTLTLIQSALHRFPDTDKTPKLFQSLVKTYRECDSAPFVFDLLIKACLRSTRIDQAMEIVRMLKSRGIYPSVSTCNLVIRSVSKYRGCYAGYDFYKEVFGFGDEGKSRTTGVFKVVPNVHTFNVIMLGFHQDGLVGNVEEVWGEMEALGCEPSGYSYSILMAAYCEDGKMGESVKLWEEMGIKGLKPDSVAYNTMIGGFCKICEVGRAEEFFREMGLSGVECSCVTFEHLINGYCQIGDVDSALSLYEDMCRKGFRSESSTVDAVIRGLGGENRVSEALEFLRVAIRKHEIAPKRKSYEVLIKGLCQEGRMEEALKLQAEMVGKGFELNCEIYSAFIEANTKEGNVELAEMLKKEMFETQMPKEEE
ncbi:hypothetical protein RHSIM_Rhsim11G0171900 [Rhododendron simsii]|uniref:PROP1-like PPR domain-containing protein n=1 Tax=Rhododendron simsii TaxID=118357 RepID=A0A834G7Y6_RHOSS|nr:hypothetical protein RHSIM_Rhsim11G0171900 [Rhododendron simsii]